MNCLMTTLILVGMFKTSDCKSVDKTSIVHSTHVQKPSRSQYPPDDHDVDSACRTIYEADKAALLAIQGATDVILKVIEKMSIEARPTGPVSAFIKVPKQLEVDKNGRPTEGMQKTIASQLVNKEGFNISYNDKLSLEMIKTAAEDIKTQLLHIDLPERLIKPRSVNERKSKRSSNEKSKYHHKKRRTGLFHRRSNEQNMKEPGRKPDTNPFNKSHNVVGVRLPPSSTCENSKDLGNIEHAVQALHAEIDDIGRKLREEYIDNSNLERTDIKSASDNLKKLQGMLSITNHTILAELLKIYEEQTKAHSYLEKKLSDMESVLNKLYTASIEKKEDKKTKITGTNRVAKSIDEVGNKDDNEEDAENDDYYPYDTLADEDV